MKTAKPSSTRAHTQEGGREGGGKQGQPATTKQRGNKRKNNQRQTAGKGSTQQAGRTQAEKGGKVWKETQPWHPEGQTVQSRRGKKAKKIGKAQTHFWEEGVSQTMRSASRDPPGRRGKVHSAIPKYPGSHPERGGMVLCQVAIISFLLFISFHFKFPAIWPRSAGDILQSCDFFQSSYQ